MFTRKTRWPSREEHEADRDRFHRAYDSLKLWSFNTFLAGLGLSGVLLIYGAKSAPEHHEYTQATQSLKRLESRKERLLSEERLYSGQSQELTKLVEMHDLERKQTVKSVDTMIAGTQEEVTRISKTPSFIQNEEERNEHYLKYTLGGIGLMVLSAFGSLAGFRIARENIRAKYGSRVNIPAELYG